ncbi:hypothetical protein HPB51_007284 [Rhipicephalus microplus]|uniref:SAM domain-containing protein n=1 Tax=Rhipicephalus microplus TaxID=6941 RepID=A0A9J6E7X9_RHIMP|nr:polyhomeotic-like protein 2 [Rhipicephalus microplus]KAH8030471.1 hypothetical protein HPB51_007284 [Rhipicephalus microplus]
MLSLEAQITETRIVRDRTTTMSNASKRGRPTRRRETGKAKGTACRGGRQRNGASSRKSAERWLETTELAVPPPATSVPEPLLERIPQERCTKPDVTTHVICGHVVQEASEFFECEWRAQPNAEPGPSAVDASRSRELSLVNRNARTSIDSRNGTPLRLSGVTHASAGGSATFTATSAVASKPTSTLSTPPPPPLLAPCVTSARGNPVSTVICVCGGHQPTAASQRNHDRSRSIPTTNPDNQAANSSSHTASEAAASDDALMREEGDELAASAACPPSQRPCAGERAIAEGARTRRSVREITSQTSPPDPSTLAQAPTEKSAEEWTVEDVVRYVKGIPGCARHAEKFRKEEVDGEALLALGIKHLIVYMGLPHGPVVKILRATRELRMRQRPK